MHYAMPYVPVVIFLPTMVLGAQDLAPGDSRLSAPAPNHNLRNNGGDSGWVGAWMRVAAKAVFLTPGIGWPR
jgi:hypothetical protein